MEYVVETYDLGKIYRIHEGVVAALDHENLQVRKRAVFGFLEPNGAGKTTLIMTLMGLTLPTSGTARVPGYDIIKESLKVRRGSWIRTRRDRLLQSSRSPAEP